MTESSTWEELAELIAAKDTDAMGQFVDHVGSALRRWLLSRGALPSDAEEAAINAVGDAVLAIDQFASKGSGSLFAWVSRIAWHNYLRMRRKDRTVLHELDSLIDLPMHQEEDHEDAPGLTLAVRNVLVSLSDGDRDLVVARAENSGLTFHELGAHFGLSEGATRIRYHRIKTSLAKTLEHDPEVVKWLRKATPEKAEGATE